MNSFTNTPSTPHEQQGPDSELPESVSINVASSKDKDQNSRMSTIMAAQPAA